MVHVKRSNVVVLAWDSHSDVLSAESFHDLRLKPYILVYIPRLAISVARHEN